jgi:hypothetical protein
VTDLIAAITTITDPRDFPCCTSKRETYITPEPVRVLVWRILSRDDDRNEDHTGTLVSETADEITILEDGDAYPTYYPKRTTTGVTLYRMQVIPTRKATP